MAQAPNQPDNNPTPIQKILNAFGKFFQTEALGGILLIIATAIALIWANSPLGESYFKLWDKTYLGINIGGFEIDKNLHHWINDGLMALFFFVVGLEIKREILMGELSTPRKSAMPIAAAIGGMVVPALIYIAFNFGESSMNGWGIPMATDIAFVIGIMALLGSKAPVALKVFLTALAIVDDLGAVLVIALFYSSDISIINLLIGVGVFGVMYAGNLAGIRNTAFYGVLGIGGLWLAFLLSGVHATIAGVLAAFAIPANMRIDKFQFRDSLQSLVQRFSELKGSANHALSGQQLKVLEEVEESVSEVEPPLQKLEHGMHPWVMYLVMPIFALANAGVVFTPEAMSSLLSNPVSIGVFLGLVLGKVGGITLFSWIAEKTGLAQLPTGSNWLQVIGAGFLAGIGFTMSLFITALAFEDPVLSDLAKMAILFGSLIAGITGYLVVRGAAKEPIKQPASSIQETIRRS